MPAAVAPPDPRLRVLLEGYPDDLFSDSFYSACEWVDRYVLSLTVRIADTLDLPLDPTPATAQEMARVRGLQPGFLPALRWVLERLTESGMVLASGSGDERTYCAPAALVAPDAAALRAALMANDPRHAPTLKLLDLAAETYPAVARGETTGSDALFGLGQVALWTDYFHNDNPIYAVNNRVAAHSAAARLALFSQRRVLELGAGAGSASAALLAELDRRGIELESYRVTEPSQFFRRRGERSLRTAFDRAPLAFAALDIDRPWAEQGVAPESADLVYAVNVLHVARDLQHSLREARAALAPGGWLVLGEAQRLRADQPMWAEFVFQLLDSFTEVELDSELRPTHGFLQPETWLAALTRAGFTETVLEPDVFAIRAIYPRFYSAAVCGRCAI